MPAFRDKPTIRIGLLSAPNGNGNLGDEATVAAVIQNIRRRYPTATIYAFSHNPDDTRGRHGIPAFPITRTRSHAPAGVLPCGQATITPGVESSGNLRHKVKATLKAFSVIYTILKAIYTAPHSILNFLAEVKFLMTSFKYLKGTDLLILTGSGVLSDQFGGPFNFPYTIFKWSLLAKASGTPFAFVSVGVGPLHAWLSRHFIKYSLSLARYQSTRDLTSKQVLDALGIDKAIHVYPDLASSLHVNTAQSHQRNHRPIIGINAFPHFDSRYWHISDPVKYQRYITTLATFTTWLIQNKYMVVFFPTQIRADTLVIQDIKECLSKRGAPHLGNAFIEKPIHDVTDLISQLATLDLVVATRFHGILLSLLMNKPVLALANHHKMTDLMTDMGQSQYVLDINTFTCESLIELFIALEGNSQTVKRQIACRVSEYQYALDRQYNILLSERVTSLTLSTGNWGALRRKGSLCG
jgi:polysaccharide pyruvyl transferase WcaK-like protein